MLIWKYRNGGFNRGLLYDGIFIENLNEVRYFTAPEDHRYCILEFKKEHAEFVIRVVADQERFPRSRRDAKRRPRFLPAVALVYPAGWSVTTSVFHLSGVRSSSWNKYVNRASSPSSRAVHALSWEATTDGGLDLTFRIPTSFSLSDFIL